MDQMDSSSLQGVWEPKEGDLYYFLDAEGESGCDVMTCEEIDDMRIGQGMAFASAEEAENEARRRAVMWKLKKLAGGFVPDWSGHNPPKHFITYSNNLKQWVADYTGMYQAPNTIYFASHEAAQNAIDTLGDELMVLL